MHRLALTDPEAPPLSELVRGVPAFRDLPHESSDCLKSLRRGMLEVYATADEVSVADDLIVVCSGALRAEAAIELGPGDVLGAGPGPTALTANRLTMVLRFDADALHDLCKECPSVAAAIEQQLSRFNQAGSRGGHAPHSST